MEELMKETERLVVLNSMRITMACHVRDWAQDKRDIWLWGIIVGWDDDAKAEMVPRWMDEDNWKRMQQYHRILWNKYINS